LLPTAKVAPAASIDMFAGMASVFERLHRHFLAPFLFDFSNSVLKSQPSLNLLRRWRGSRIRGVMECSSLLGKDQSSEIRAAMPLGTCAYRRKRICEVDGKGIYWPVQLNCSEWRR